MRSPHNNIPNSDSTVRNKKISRIWCLARDLGMTGKNKEGLYLVVESITGKDSISSLDMLELDMVNRSLKSLLFKQNRQKYLENSKNSKNGTTYLPTPAQKDLVSDYLNKLTELLKLNVPEFYLESICRKTFRKDYKKLNRNEMQRLIETLKSIYHRPLKLKEIKNENN